MVGLKFAMKECPLEASAWRRVLYLRYVGTLSANVRDVISDTRQLLLAY